MQVMSVDYGAQVADLMARMAKPGLLLVVPDTRRRANVMTIGWGFFGYVWDFPMCAVMVRPSRYSYDFMNRAGVFTVNRMPDSLEKAVGRCGSVSGRDVDKYR